jgi:aryl-alcohol dehydrogenase-like predicted oxidoreductase
MGTGAQLTRRQAILGSVAGVAGMAGIFKASPTAAAPAAAAVPAAAAGTISVGGDLSVNRMGFGAMRITGPGIWGPPEDPAEAQRVLRRAIELGVNFIDTADAYGPDVSEELIGRSLYPYPRGVIIATKGGMVRPGPGDWTPDGRPQHLRAACEASLKRLKLARIDLYQLHRVDPKVPLEDSIGELARLRSEGKIRHIGVSNFSAAELERARRVVPIVSVQNRYNVADRAAEDVLAVCARDGLAFIPWAPIGRGAHGVSVLQVAIAWLLAKSAVMLPIPGTSSVPHLEQNVAAAAVQLSAAELAAIG